MAYDKFVTNGGQICICPPPLVRNNQLVAALQYEYLREAMQDTQKHPGFQFGLGNMPTWNIYTVQLGIRPPPMVDPEQWAKQRDLMEANLGI